MVKLNRRIPVSETVFSYMKHEIEEQFLKNNPSYDGKKVTFEMKMRSLIKTYLGIFNLNENDRNKHNRNV